MTIKNSVIRDLLNMNSSKISDAFKCFLLEHKNDDNVCDSLIVSQLSNESVHESYENTQYLEDDELQMFQNFTDLFLDNLVKKLSESEIIENAFMDSIKEFINTQEV